MTSTPASPASYASTRLLSPDALELGLVHAPVAAGSVRAGSPTVGTAELAATGRYELGVWELEVGEVTDVEVDETFVVLAGRGTVTFEDGSVLDLGPGSVARLQAGDRTVWSITERLRKVYVV